MKILVGVASKHGATQDIAARIAARLSDHGHTTELQKLDNATHVSHFDAFVLGSAIYMDAWRKEARSFVDTHLDLLRTKPVWLFSSGPLGDDIRDGVPPARTEQLTAGLHAFDHHVFPGRLDPSTLGPGERLVAAVVRAPAGDFRPWDEIDEWADGIAQALAVADVSN